MPASAPRPNVVSITTHDMGQHIGCYGVDSVDTPNMDRLADEGVRFEESFCTAPHCSPSRASIYTGRYPHSNGMLGLAQGNHAWDLHDDERHTAEILSDHGWHASLVGMQHETLTPGEIFDDVSHHLPMAPTLQCADVVDEAESYLGEREGADDPFYMQLGFYEPHKRSSLGSPYSAAFHDSVPDASADVTVPEYIVDEESAREEFDAFERAIEDVDRAIGQVLDELDRRGMAENTIVLMTSDHGIPFPRAKLSAYDAGHEVPLVIRWPDGPIPAGAVRENLVSNVDYLPTILDLLDVPIPERVQGRSFAGAFRDDEDYEPRDRVYGEISDHKYSSPRRFVRTDDHKLIVNFACNPVFQNPTQSWRPKTRAKYPADTTYTEPVELYDITDDPLETENVAEDDRCAEVRAELLADLHDWMQRTDDPLLDGIPTPPMHGTAMAELEGASGR